MIILERHISGNESNHGSNDDDDDGTVLSVLFMHGARTHVSTTRLRVATEKLDIKTPAISTQNGRQTPYKENTNSSKPK